MAVLVPAATAGGVAIAAEHAANAGAISATACARPTDGSRPAPIFYRPASLGREVSVPLVIGLYASGGTPASFEATSGFDRLADEHGFVVAYLGSAAPAAAWNPHTDDLAYVSSVIDQLTAPGDPCGPIDPRRVYVTGFSLGGFETFRAGCELSGKVAAIAPVSQGMLASRPCNLSRPVSELTIVGSDDAVPLLPTAGIPIDTRDTTARWRRIDGCSTSSRGAAQGPVTETTWHCNDGGAVALYVLAGGDHQWPGAPQSTGPDTGYDASQAIWAFFAAHPGAPRTAAPPQIVSVTVAGRATRSVRVVATVGESAVRDPGNPYYRPLELQAQLRDGRAEVIASRTATAIGRTRTSIDLPLPRGAGSGPYSIRLVFSDSYGRSATIVRQVHVPSAT